MEIVENTDFEKLIRYKDFIIEEKENYDTYEELYDNKKGSFEYLFRHLKKIAFANFIRNFDDHYRNMRNMTSDEYLDDNDINIEAMIDNAAEIEHITSGLRSFLSDIESIDDFKEQLESFVDDILEDVDYDEAVSALDRLTFEFTDNIDEALDEAAKTQVRHELRDQVIDYIIDQGLEYQFIRSGESAVEFVQPHLGNKDYIDEVVSDPSLGDRGAEAVTYPIPPSEIDSVVKEVCDFINTHGLTNKSTGLHYNISLTRADFNLDNFNMLKFLLLLDEGYVAHDFGRTISSYAVQMQSQLDNEVIIEEAINAFIENGISGLEDVSEKYLTNKPRKYDGINILNLSTGANLGQNRIEVRYPGGSYSNEPNKVIWHAYRMLYTLMTAFNEDFKREEYLRALYDFWSDVTEERYDLDFAEAIRRYRHHGTLSSSDE